MEDGRRSVRLSGCRDLGTADFTPDPIPVSAAPRDNVVCAQKTAVAAAPPQCLETSNVAARLGSGRLHSSLAYACITPRRTRADLAAIWTGAERANLTLGWYVRICGTSDGGCPQAHYSERWSNARKF